MARKKTAKYHTTPVEAVTHRKDKRVNIPTAEMVDFAVKEEQVPYTLRYPRDPSLDPQLVWKGKDGQDGRDLEVPGVPIYIQEHIKPQAIIDDLRRVQAGDAPAQAGLFDDFDGMQFAERIDFYRHAQNWTNRMILGDSLLVMGSLAEKEGLKGKVQMIYMDPPYGISFRSNWQVSTRSRDVKDGKIEDATREPEQIKAFRDTWKLGIHSYLAYWRDRLVLARALLTDTGSIFVQIGDANVHLVRCLLDEVFGKENFSAVINFRSMTPLGQRGLASVYDYILWYTKDLSHMKFRPIFIERHAVEEPEFCFLDKEDGSYRKITTQQVSALSPKELTKVFKRSVLTSSGYTASCTYSFEHEGKNFAPLSGKSWRTHPDGMQRLERSNRLILLGKNPYFRQYHADFPLIQMENSWHDTAAGFSEEKIYVVQTPERIIERCILMTTDPGDLVLDPTCGSGTTAYAGEHWGRRWVTIDTSRVAIALARTRLMSSRFAYYILADSPEGITREAEVTGQLPPSPLPPTEGDIKRGFVYKRVPRIKLEHIANNPEIDDIHGKWQKKLESIRTELNRVLKQSWEEWQIPHDPDKAWPQKAKDLLVEWWQLQRGRQTEINAAIACHTDSETLYDKPYEDSKTIRVAGPFTVESLSPHRVLSPDQHMSKSEEAATRGVGPGQFETMILENLLKAGVQQYDKNERLKFSRLEPYAGLYIHCEGEFEENGKSRRVAVCIGPEHGTVGPELVKEAAKEAVRGIGFDMLIVCGFAFDPHVGEEARQYGKLKVLTAKINPDLQLGDEFLKRTGAGNLFMVFGEPDIAIRKDKEGKFAAEIKGVDVYDPTTGQIRSHSTDDIACWFIDTDYNEEAFFVRHAYFCGADEPYDKLRRALKADIDEAAWSTLYSTKSRPFDQPGTGKIAVKVINHYGDEVLKVYEI